MRCPNPDDLSQFYAPADSRDRAYAVRYVDNRPIRRAHRVNAWVRPMPIALTSTIWPPPAFAGIGSMTPSTIWPTSSTLTQAGDRTPRDKVALNSSLIPYMRSPQRSPAEGLDFCRPLPLA